MLVSHERVDRFASFHRIPGHIFCKAQILVLDLFDGLCELRIRSHTSDRMVRSVACRPDRPVDSMRCVVSRCTRIRHPLVFRTGGRGYIFLVGVIFRIQKNPIGIEGFVDIFSGFLPEIRVSESVLMVAISSSLIRRLYPTTSALKIAVSLRCMLCSSTGTLRPAIQSSPYLSLNVSEDVARFKANL